VRLMVARPKITYRLVKFGEKSFERQEMRFVRPERIWLKQNSDLSEKWVQDRISEDPAILGMGDLIIRDRERIQPRAGRLDLLLQDPDTNRRYEVELQLGATDESHIIRTIEYWDIERKRYPQYEHCAVLIAEDITSRFLNVISLFNGTIPLVAIQMQALRVEDGITLVFTRVLDELSRGVVDEDEDAAAAPTDRAYWEQRSSRESLAILDTLFELAKTVYANLDLSYNKFYVGVQKDGQPFNFFVMRPKRNFLRLELKIQRSDEVDRIISESGLDVMDYDERWGYYRIRMTRDDANKNRDQILKLMNLAFEARSA